MKILAVSDKVEKSFLNPRLIQEQCSAVEMILSCGDLPAYYLESLINNLNRLLFYIPGNHDDNHFTAGSGEDISAKGCRNIDQKVVYYKKMLIGGLGGARRYRKGKFMYTEKQMRQKIFHMTPRLIMNRIAYRRYIDILVTHAPPFGVHDEKDQAHQGFKEFISFIKTFKPAYLIHGHTLPQAGKETVLNFGTGTHVININPYHILNIRHGTI